MDVSDAYQQNSRRAPRAAAILLIFSSAAICNAAHCSEDRAHDPNSSARSPNASARDQNLSVPGSVRQFDIPASVAKDALHKFAVATRLSVISTSRKVRRAVTNALHGYYSPTDALQALLAGTGLTYSVMDDIVVIEEIAAPETPRTKPTASSIERARPQLAFTAPADEIITVTGLLGPSAQRAPLGVRVISITSEDMDRMGGLDVPALLRSLPQVFGGGPSEDTHIGREATTNSSVGSGINIRGLGAGATLILIDGRRLAPSGDAGAFADVSNIPLSSIERIDIMPDGSGSAYGADGPGGVVNFILKRDFGGLASEGWFGGSTDDTLHEHRYSFLGGKRFSDERASASLAFEHYDRGDLPAADRSLATSGLGDWQGANSGALFGNPGNIVLSGGLWAIPVKQNGLGLSSEQVQPGTPHLYDQQLGASVLPAQDRDNALLSLLYRAAPDLELFANSLVGQRAVQSFQGAVSRQLQVHSTNPYYVSPTSGGTDPVTVDYGFYRDLGPQKLHGDVTTTNSALGFDWSSPFWRASGYVSYTSERERLVTTGLVNDTNLLAALKAGTVETAFDALGDGSFTYSDVLDSIRDSSLFASHSDIKGAHLRGSYRLFATAAGNTWLTLGAEYFDQTFTYVSNSSTTSDNAAQHLGRSGKSLFAQVEMPVFAGRSPENDAGKLSVIASGRLDAYSDTGNPVDPWLAVNWMPVDAVVLRGTWGRSFQPVNLVDRVTFNAGSLAAPVVGPSGNAINTLIVYGNNPELRPQTAHTWSFGATWTPAAMPGSSVSLTFFDIVMRGRIDQVQFAPDALTSAAFNGRTTLNPTPAQVAEVCKDSTFAGAPSDCTDTQFGALVDTRLKNIQTLRTRGIDMLALWNRETSAGRLSFRLDGTYLLNYSEALAPGLPDVSLLNTQNNPINLRLLGTLTWKRGGLEISAAQSYANSYRDTSMATVSRNIASWRSTDLNLDYTLRRALLPGATSTEVFFRVADVFDQYPPFLNNTITHIGYDQENGDLLGRFVTIGTRLQW